jgi:hypothetical protein
MRVDSLAYDPDDLDRLLPPLTGTVARSKLTTAPIALIPADLPHIDIDQLPLTKSTKRLIRNGVFDKPVWPTSIFGNGPPSMTAPTPLRGVVRRFSLL